MGFEEQRRNLVEDLKDRGLIKLKLVENAMLKVPRELFVRKEDLNSTYSDKPSYIVGEATISAPHMHAILLTASKLKKGDKVLEIGAGSGILLAYMKEVVGEKGKVFGIEIDEDVCKFARQNLKKAGYYKKVKLILGDGSKGFKKEMPYDKIISSAACEEVPKEWFDQLKNGGILITPVGKDFTHQDLFYFEKTKEGKLIRKNLGGVVFVPLKTS